MINILKILIIIILLAAIAFIGKDKLAAFYSNKGYDYYESAAYEEAIDYFNKSLILNPSVSTVHYNLAKAYEEARLTEEAISEYRKAIQLDTSFVWGYEALANIYFEKKLYKEAIALLEEAAINAPDNQEIRPLIDHVSSGRIVDLVNTATGAFLSGDRAKAHKLLNKALQINPNLASAQYTLGYLYYTENQYDKAVDKLKQAIKLDSKYFSAHKLLGDIYFEQKAFGKAVTEYKAASAIDKQDAAICNNIGIALMNLEDYQEAIKFLKEAISLDPENINYRYSLASVYRDAGRFKESALEYSRIINRQPNYPNVHNDLAGVYEQEGREEEAIEEYKMEINFCKNKLLTSPDDPFLLNGIACAYNGIGEYDKAKTYVKKAIAIKPDYREAYLTLSNIENNLCNFEGSMAALKQAKALSPRKLLFIEQAMDNVRQLKFFSTTVIYMKNKRRFEGIIKRETKDSITLEIDIGSSVGTVRLSRDDIERIVNKE